MGLTHLAFQRQRLGVAGEVRQPVQLASLRRRAAGSANGSIGWPQPQSRGGSKHSADRRHSGRPPDPRRESPSSVGLTATTGSATTMP
jgi:hypothetical protein